MWIYLAAKYLYIETSSPRRIGDIARLESSSASYSGAYCFSFWYHMYGSSIGSLNIYTQQGGSVAMQRKWRLQGNQGNRWHKAEVDLNSTSSSDYKVSAHRLYIKGKESSAIDVSVITPTHSIRLLANGKFLNLINTWSSSLDKAFP